LVKNLSKTAEMGIYVKRPENWVRNKIPIEQEYNKPAPYANPLTRLLYLGPFMRPRACIRMPELREASFLSEVKLLHQITIEHIYSGIDVAQDSLVVATKLAGKVTTTLHQNNQKGIAGFLKSLPSQTWCLLEATGVYSLQLAIAL
jgi:hypothetical protein